MTGQPTYDRPAIVKTICEALAKGIPLTHICREEGMPNPSTVWDWSQEDESIAQAIAHARELGHDALAEQCLDISDDETHDWAMSKKGAVTDEVAIGRAKLRVWTRLQLLAKWNPKKYGDKIAVDAKHSGNVGMTILTAVPEASSDGAAGE